MCGMRILLTVRACGIVPFRAGTLHGFGAKAALRQRGAPGGSGKSGHILTSQEMKNMKSEERGTMQTFFF